MTKPFSFGIAATVLAALAWMTVSPGYADEDPRVELARKLPGGVKPEELKSTPIPGLYELNRGGEVGYVSADGRYYLSGELHDLKTNANLTEQSMKEVRRKLLAAVADKDMIVFGPSSQYMITVFTDIDCGYCRKLHEDVPKLNQMGIQVRYLFFPRSGPNTPSWKEAENIWCSSDRNDALTRAKRGEAIRDKTCRGSDAIGRQYALGRTLGIQGTPGIFTGDADYIKGYLPPAQMLAQLQRLKAAN